MFVWSPLTSLVTVGREWLRGKVNDSWGSEGGWRKVETGQELWRKGRPDVLRIAIWKSGFYLSRLEEKEYGKAL